MDHLGVATAPGRNSRAQTRRDTTENIGGELVSYCGTTRAGVHGDDVGLGSCTKRERDEARGFIDGD
jgi:hypothetical protein